MKPRIRENLEVLLAALREAKIGKIIVSYDGGGDSGQMHTPVASWDETLSETALMDLVNQKPDLKKLAVTYSMREYEYPDLGSLEEGRWIETKIKVDGQVAAVNIASTYLEDEHGGWENNDGGEGEILIDVESSTMSCNHGQYYTEINWTEVSFSLDDDQGDA